MILVCNKKYLNCIKSYYCVLMLCMHLGLRQCGSLNLAQTKDRMISLKRRIAYNSPAGLHCEVA